MCLITIKIITKFKYISINLQTYMVWVLKGRALRRALFFFNPHMRLKILQLALLLKYYSIIWPSQLQFDLYLVTAKLFESDKNSNGMSLTCSTVYTVKHPSKNSLTVFKIANSRF